MAWLKAGVEPDAGYAVRMSGSTLSPPEIRAAAEAYAELEPAYSGARLAGMGQPEPSAGLDRRPRCHLLKGIGIGVGVAVSGIAVLVVGGSPGERLPGLLCVLLALMVACAAGADGAGRARVVRTGPLAGQG
jgi:hypothetical protein